MYLICNRLVNHTSDCPEISQIDKVGDKYVRFCGHDIFFLTATTKPSQAMFTVGTLYDRRHCTMLLLHFQKLQVFLRLTHHMPIRYNALHAPMLPEDVSGDAANL